MMSADRAFGYAADGLIRPIPALPMGCKKAPWLHDSRPQTVD